MPAVTLRPLAESDLNTVVSWFAEPHVTRWWEASTEPAAVRRRYADRIAGREPTEAFVIEAAGRPVGLIQRYLISDHPDWADALLATGAFSIPAAGIDYLIGDPTATGQGLASAAIRRLALRTLDRDAHLEAVVAAPFTDNIASWRTLERAGFTRTFTGPIAGVDSHLYLLRR
ncbi:aminoglycoside 6'-N-acetyltransferase [Catenuloplanes nepalensis]|uniref:Lysine N-acyltransferase MbtK n=1 Tax=Catenuloplanes nepalensis TaxID=587533 RepID=A0ABT9MJH0_9ACTN|nr:GNAT family N-acetyltransferase [Catenuloplanes nepalensis]MDP9791552.1 aminoglycoside 6'-N-acetyltransferase [Catenuloplanes nepalensis]